MHGTSRFNVVGTDGDGIGDDVEWNLISGNNGYNGIFLTGANVTDNVMAGNLIGTDITGTLALGNRGSGIEIKDGASSNHIGTDANGVSDALERNIIAGNTGHGLFIWSQFAGPPQSNTVAGNYVGTDITGTIDIGNGASGVHLGTGASNNIVGTNGDGIGDSLEGNVISGNARNGVAIADSGTNNNRIAGNFIGTDRSGKVALGNSQNGVSLTGGQFNLIGTDGVGGADAVERNVISGNLEDGVAIANADNNTVAGNYIGTDVTGNAALANSQNGIFLSLGASGNTIGGAPGLRNIVSGHLANTGIAIDGAGLDNWISANYVGLGADGSTMLGNLKGITVNNAFGQIIGTNSDGVGDDREGNVVTANNLKGIELAGNSENNVIAGNIVGTGPDGLTRIGSQQAGVTLGGNAKDNLVGTNGDGQSDVFERNIIAVAQGNEVELLGAGVTDNRVAGNFIGLGIDGTTLVLNGDRGVTIEGGASGNFIGTNSDRQGDASEGNVIVGMTQMGIRITASNGNFVAGNLIGTDSSGLMSAPNAIGVVIENGASGNIIGSDGDGASDGAERNVISGNAGEGVALRSDANIVDGIYDSNIVAGNYIGVGIDGESSLGNASAGVLITGAGNRVGGPATPERNVISANLISADSGGQGIRVTGDNSVIQGNYIGLNASGNAAVPNESQGIAILGGSATLIGGANAGNVISGNADAGIQIQDSISNKVQGNRIGTSANGMSAIPNTFGVLVSSGTLNNVIGTDGNSIDDAAEGNLISGNSQDGVGLQGGGITQTVVAGNLIGVAIDGTSPLGNSIHGIGISLGANNNRIGTNGDAVSDALERNIIAANGGSGIAVVGSDGNVVDGNVIGTDASATLNRGNVGNGITIDNANTNSIGGIAGNTIAFQSLNGVAVSGSSTANTIQANSIYSNSGLGIDLAVDGVTLNDPGDGDAGANGLQNFPLLDFAVAGGDTRVVGRLDSSINSVFTIDFYADATADPTGFGEGGRYLGSATVFSDGSGEATFDVTIPGNTFDFDQVTATATDSVGNTSEFSAAVVARVPSGQPPAIASDDLLISVIEDQGEGVGLPTTTIDENDQIALTGLFNPTNVGNVHQVQVDWGDGSVIESVTLPANDIGFTLTHRYPDNNPNLDPADVYNIKVTVIDTGTNGSGFAILPLTVSNVDPLISGTTLLTSSINEGSSASLTINFEDPGSDQHTLEIDWDDGSEIQSVTVPTGVRQVTVDHRYVDDTGSGVASIGVTVLDDDSGSDQAVVDLKVQNVAPTGTIIVPPEVFFEGDEIVLDATAFDPGSLDAVSYNWTIKKNNAFFSSATTRQVSFTPDDDGAYSASLTVKDNSGASGTATVVVINVLNAAPQLDAGGIAITNSHGQPVSSIEEGDTIWLAGQFADAGIRDRHRIEIDWGDNSPVLVMPLEAGTVNFSGLTHTYADDKPVEDPDDDYVISVQVYDNSEDSATGSRTLTVMNVAPQALIDANNSTDTTVNLVASVTDPGADGFNYAWSIDHELVGGDSPTVSFPRPSTMSEIMLSVSDDDGASVMAMTVFIEGTNVVVSPGEVDGTLDVDIDGTIESIPISGIVFDKGNDDTEDNTFIVESGVVVPLSVNLGGGNNTADLGDAPASVTSVGNDTITTSTLTTTISFGSFSTKTLISGGGLNTLDFSRIPDSDEVPGTGLSLDLSVDDGTTQVVRDSDEQVSLQGTFQNITGTSYPDRFTGNSVGNVIFGGPGEDSISGGSGGNDVLDGGEGNDTLSGGDGNDVIYGGIGDDSIFGGKGDETLVGGDGNDVIYGGGSIDDSVTGAGGMDIVDGGSGDDTLIGSDGNDMIFGGDGDDSIVGGEGDEMLDGGDGNDVIFGGGEGDDSVSGGRGDDTLIGSDGNDMIFGGEGNDSIVGGDGGDETLIGGDGNDIIYGGSGDDSVGGTVGTDIVDGGSGDDTLIGSGGNDMIYGGTGDDSIVGGSGDETLIGGDGNDMIYGGGGTNDSVSGGVSHDVVDGGGGDDTLVGSDGNDMIFGGGGDDSIIGGGGDEILEGGDGNDIIYGGSSDNDSIAGSSGTDTVDGGSGDDTLIGGGGNDIIFGGDGDDSIIGSSGDETLGGGDGNDVIYGGGVGDDSVVGGDMVDGGSGDDTLVGGDGNDIIFGGDGDDSIVGGAGDETLEGGDGNDIIYGGSDGNDSIDGGGGDDTLVGSDGNDIIYGGIGDDSIVGGTGAGDETLSGGDGNDIIYGAGSGDDSITGDSGDDTLIGSDGNDVIYGGDGDDSIIGGLGDGDETLSGGDGNDIIYGGGTGEDSISGDGGDDTLIGGDGNDMIYGGDGDDSIVGGLGDGDQTLSGGDGNDIIYGGGSGDDSISGDNGDDTLVGSDGNDVIYGGSGDDSIVGGNGDETLVGGDGNDMIYAGTGGDDSIQGGSGNDTLEGGGGNDIIFGGTGSDTFRVIGDNTTLYGNDENGPDLDDDQLVVQSGETLILTNETLTIGVLEPFKPVILNDIQAARLIGDETDNLIDVRGFSGGAVMLGGGGDDTLLGGTGNDTLIGGSGADSLVGGAGDDQYAFQAGDVGTKTVTELPDGGIDTFDFSLLASGVTIDLAEGGTQTAAPGLNFAVVNPEESENVFGTPFRDVIRGNENANQFFGLGGFDELDGRGGDDLLQAGLSRTVVLEFGSETDSGEHAYSDIERQAIADRIREDFAAFDIKILSSDEVDAPINGPFITVLFNAGTGTAGNVVVGGRSERIGWRELGGGGVVSVNVNAFLRDPAIDPDPDNRLPGTEANFIALSSTIAAHELAHMYGLRHHDSFGPVGGGVFKGLADRSLPSFDGPLDAVATGQHLSASPAATGTTLIDALGNPYFGAA